MSIESISAVENEFEFEVEVFMEEDNYFATYEDESEEKENRMKDIANEIWFAFVLIYLIATGKENHPGMVAFYYLVSFVVILWSCLAGVLALAN